MNFLRISAIFLLLFTATGAFFGGWSLVNDPSGHDLQIPDSYLQHTPFKDYLVPGIILLVVNGLFSLVAMLWTLFKWKYYPWVLVIQGGLLTGWIIGQMILLREIYYLQFIFGGIGLVILITGILLRRNPVA